MLGEIEMKFKYNIEKEIFIKDYEINMISVYSNIIDKYNKKIKKYGCLLKLGVQFSRSIDGERCFSLCCRVLKNGKEEKFTVDDGETILYASWIISKINKEVWLNEDTSEVYEDMEIFLRNIEESLEYAKYKGEN